MDELAEAFQPLLALALAEDAGQLGDITSQAIFDQQVAKARVFCREPTVVYGLWTVQLVAAAVSPDIVVQLEVADGATIFADTVVCRLTGPVAALLRAERIMLNFLGYLSGIASKTAEFVAIVRERGSTKILDTRKTLPGYRLLSKAAVASGGGVNHRRGLDDMVLIKDNHIDASGSLEASVAAVRAKWGQRFAIEVEVRNLNEVERALALGVERIMLDNMSPPDCAAAVSLRRERFPASQTSFEASGDMNQQRIRDYSGLGLDYISVGALTHSVKNSNFSLELEQDRPRA